MIPRVSEQPLEPSVDSVPSGAVERSPRAQWVRNQFYALTHLTYYGLVDQYNRALLGLLWFLITPALLLLVYGFVLTAVFGAEIGGRTKLHHAFVILCGLMPWMTISDGLSTAAGSIVGFPTVVRNSPLPPLFLPTVKVLQMHLGLWFSYGVGLVVIAVCGYLDFGRIWVVPYALTCLLAFSLGIGWAASALTVYIRDLLQALPTILLLGLFASPILYTPDMLAGKVPAYIQAVIDWNPVTPLLGLMRSVVTTSPLNARDLMLAPVWGFGALLLGGLLFRRLEPGLGDAL